MSHKQRQRNLADMGAQAELRRMAAQAAQVRPAQKKIPAFKPAAHHPLGQVNCCGNCVFGVQLPAQDNMEEPPYECWRFPPTPHAIAIPTPQGMAMKQGSSLPTTPGAAFWCGECIVRPPMDPQPETADLKSFMATEPAPAPAEPSPIVLP